MHEHHVGKEEKAIKNLLIEVPEEFHRLIKIHSAEKGMTIKDFVMETLEKELKKSKHSYFGE